MADDAARSRLGRGLASLIGDVGAESQSHERVSRSQLYAQAIEEYLGKRQDSLITERLNALYAARQEPLDHALAAAQIAAISHEAW